MYSILMVIHVIVAVLLIGLILIQQGKGAQTGASFGTGASQTVFGSQGSSGFIGRATAILATIFFLSNLGAAYLVTKQSRAAKMIEAPIKTAPANPNKSETQDSNIPKF